jgi:integrase
MAGVRLLAEHNRRDRVCTRKEYQQLLAAAPPVLRLAIVLGFHTGMRLGEIASLTWAQIDLKRGIAKLRAQDTKTGQGRVVPLAREVIAELESAPRNLDGAVVGATTGTLSPAFTRLTRELGLADLRFHDLRHTAATNLRRAGVDIFTIKEITGHKTLAMLERYNTIDVQDLREAVEKATKVER